MQYYNTGKKKKKAEIEYLPLITMLVSTFIIICIGVLMLYSTSFHKSGAKFLIKQAQWVVFGGAIATGVIIIGYKNFYKFNIPYILIGLSTIGLLWAKFLSAPINGANRWIKTPIGSIQPSEYAKIAMLLFMSWYCKKYIRHLNMWFAKKGLFKFIHKRGFLVANIVPSFVLFLILWGGDLGTAVLLFIAIWSIYFIAGVNLKTILSIPLILAVTAFYAIVHFDEERWARLTTFLNIENNPLMQRDEGYQLWNSLLAFGSGDWFGVGFGESMLKLKYLPEAHTDFILAITGEELGAIGLFFIIGLYVIFAISGIIISIKSSSIQGKFLGSSITIMILAQAFINIGVVTGSIPTKGMPAPMISYGGSNMVSCLIGIGFLVSIAVEPKHDYIVAKTKEVIKKIVDYFFH